MPEPKTKPGGKSSLLNSRELGLGTPTEIFSTKISKKKSLNIFQLNAFLAFTFIINYKVVLSGFYFSERERTKSFGASE